MEFCFTKDYSRLWPVDLRNIAIRMITVQKQDGILFYKRPETS